MIGQTVSHYKILEKLGEGGMGVVYKAEDTKLKRTVALKFLPPELTRDKDAKTRFIHEAQAASALQHHNICAIHEIDETNDGRMFISMDCYEGETLRDKIARGSLPVEQAFYITTQVAEGLAKAHDAGMVHRDIKPANIMVTNDGVVKILDFGLAKLAGQTRVTKTGTTVGTVAYMSPEQATGKDVDHRSDVFSLGAVLYEMLTGELPFKGDHEAAVLYGIINGEPELLATRRGDVPKSLDKVIAKMLAKRPDLRYESMIELTTDLNMIRASTRPLVTARSRIRFGLAASLIALAAVALVILKPTIFGLRENVNSPTEVEALAVMYFDNLADRDDPDRWGEIVTNLLITNLSETEHIRVVSSQRLYDILKAQGKQGAKTIDRDTAIDVATAAGVKWMLLGSIITQHPNLVITSHLVDTESGEVEATQRVAGGPDEQIYPLIDKLTMEVESDLGFPGLARNEKEMSIKDVTTSSTEAYRHYLEGMDYHNLGLREKGKESFEKALACDSTYAMAYYQLAGFLMPGTGREKRAAIDEALRYSDRVTRKERLLIQCQSYYLAGEITRSIEILEVVAREYQEEKEVYMQLGWCYAKNRRDIRSAIPYYLRVLELDPLSKRAYNQLAYFYSHVGVPDSSVWAINKLIALVPNEPSPYDTRGDLYKWDGEIQKAMDSYRKSYSLEPEFFWALESLGLLHLHKGEVETARRQFQEILGKSNATARGRARLCMAMIPLYKGKLEEAQEVLSHGIGSDEMEGYEGAAYLDKLHFSSLVYARRGDYDRANATFNKLLDAHRRVNPENLLDWQYDHAYLLSMQKRFSEAEEISREMRASVVDTTNLELMYRYWLARGLIELERGDFDSACHYLQEAQKTVKWFFVRYPMALAYLKAGRLSDAVREFERIVERYERLTLYRMFDPVWAVTAHYYLGVAYEESGWNNKAIEQYGEFLDTWKDADPGIPEVEDAKGRLTKLKSKE